MEDGDEAETKRMLWFNAFIYIFNKHWNKIDNYRIDKYLMLLRFMIAENFKWLKSVGYDKKRLDWFCALLVDTLKEGEPALNAQGIPL